MDLYLGKRLVLSMWQDWTAVFQLARENWIDLTLIQFTFEVSPISGRLETHMALIGFHLWIMWTYDREIVAAIKQAADEALAEPADEDYRAAVEDTDGPDTA